MVASPVTEVVIRVCAPILGMVVASVFFPMALFHLKVVAALRAVVVLGVFAVEGSIQGGGGVTRMLLSVHLVSRLLRHCLDGGLMAVEGSGVTAGFCFIS
jgi:hypothetical protein